MYYFKEYEQHPGEEGWYVYVKADNPQCRAIREQGPLSKEEADDLIYRLSRQRGIYD